MCYCNCYCCYVIFDDWWYCIYENTLCTLTKIKLFKELQVHTGVKLQYILLPLRHSSSVLKRLYVFIITLPFPFERTSLISDYF